MKPINAEDPSCNPISSNCVIWQGPDIECINLCKGDTVSDVVFKLATELCTILTTLDISSYDLSCFNLTTCSPSDYKDLIQFLIGRICDLEQCTGCIPTCGQSSPSQSGTRSRTTTTTGCPDCVVNIASYFYFTNPVGDTVTSMQLIDYVRAIGNKVCDLVSEITTIQSTLIALNNRVTILENTPPPVYTPPTVTPQCVLASVPQQMDVVLIALEAQFCNLVNATGTPISLYQNIAKQCAGLNSELMLSGTGAVMSSIPGWSSVVTNLAQSFGNMWLTICDMRNAIRNIQLNCCPTGCDGINLSLMAILDTNILNVYVTGTVPPGFAQCLGTTSILITDSNGNSITVAFDLLGYLNNPTGYPVSLLSTPIDISLDLTIVIQPCLVNTSTDTRCESYLSYLLSNSALCPTITFTETETSVSYSFTSNLGNYTYTVELWDSAGITMLFSQVSVVNGVNLVSGTFSGLSCGTTYKIRVSIIPTTCSDCSPVVCPFSIITTVACPCPPPEDVVAEITIV